MKKLQLIVFSVLIPFSLLVFGAKTPLFSAATPRQTYESAGSSPQKSLKTAPASKKLTLKPGGSSKLANELESQMNDLNQATLLYQQETNQKIESLRNQHGKVHAKLQKLTEAMLLINQQLSAISHHQDSLASASTSLKAKTGSASINSLFKYLAFGLAVILAIMLGVLISRQKKQES